MASGRRIKLLVVATFVILVLMLVYSRGTYRERSAELDRFNANRKAAKAAAKHDKAAGAGVDDDIENAKMRQLLKDADAAAKKKANDKAPNPPPAPDAAPGGSVGKYKSDYASASDEEKAVLNEIEDILKRSPVIIFSKSYCPYSKAAKKLLMEEYKIVPPPFVVELDLHDQGSQIQDALLKRTGRRTVPNILVQGSSIGGSDDIADLEEKGELVKKVKSLGGKRIMSMDRVKEGA